MPVSYFLQSFIAEQYIYYLRYNFTSLSFEENAEIVIVTLVSIT